MKWLSAKFDGADGQLIGGLLYWPCPCMSSVAMVLFSFFYFFFCVWFYVPAVIPGQLTVFYSAFDLESWMFSLSLPKIRSPHSLSHLLFIPVFISLSNSCNLCTSLCSTNHTPIHAYNNTYVCVYMCMYICKGDRDRLTDRQTNRQTDACGSKEYKYIYICKKMHTSTLT